VDVTLAFREVAAWFSDLTSYEWEPVVAVAAEDLAYTVCLERYTASIQGSFPQSAEYRSTHVFRREAGRWRAVHRHADSQLEAD
jgi:ketosteroid isomerase-like protein